MSLPWIGIKRWRLRAGVTEDALVTLVRNEIVPQYRALDPQAVLGLLRADSADEYLATQTWPSGAYRERVCSGDRYAEWFEEYLPILARFDELAEFVDDWDSTDEPERARERECAEEGTDLL